MKTRGAVATLVTGLTGVLVPPSVHNMEAEKNYSSEMG